MAASDVDGAPLVQFSRHGGQDEVALVTLNRPSKANAISPQLLAEMNDTIDAIASDSSVRALVVTGAGKNFCSGGDLSSERPPDWITHVRGMFQRIEDLRMPTVAAVNGAAVAGGCELLLVFDLRVLADSAFISLPEVKFGAVTLAGTMQRLVKLIGLGRAKELNLLGDPVAADYAREIGLANFVVPVDQVVPRALDIATTLASRDPVAMQMTKMLLNVGASADASLAAQLEAPIANLLLADLSAKLASAAASDPALRRIVERNAAS